MKTTNKETQIGYFRFFFSILRFRLLFTICLNITIGLLDGIGLTLLIPLLQSVDPASQGKQSTGQLGVFFSIFKSMGIPLTVNVILLIFLCLFIVKACIKYIAFRYQINVQLLFIKKLQQQFLSRLQRLSYEGYLQLDAGKIQNTVVSDVSRVSEAMKNYLRWSNSFFLLLTYIFLAYLANPKFAFLITVGIALTNLLYRNLFTKIKAASYQISQKGQDLNGYLIELVHYFKYLKSTAYLSRFSLKLKSIINETYGIESRLGRHTAIIISIKEPFVVFIVVAVMLVQINVIGSSIGSILLSLMLFYRGLGNLMTLQTDWQNFLRLSGAFRMVSEISEKMEKFREPSGPFQFTSIQDEILLKNIYMSFGKSNVLKNVNIRIPKNTTIALTGVSGSGKTTLVNIISGLLKPSKGNVYIDQRALTDYDLESYRSKIGYISQESVVFNDSVYNNITFWAEPTEENKKRFWEVVEMSSLTEFLEAQDNKEQTKLGDNGILLSGGQRQRISIARELFKNPEILILDEATSALDSETERVIQENIENLHHHYTVIIIAHRFSTIKHVDEIYFLEQGEIAHSGKFTDMVTNSAKFKHLVSLQGL